MKAKFIRHEEVDSDTLVEIIKVKSKAWPYGLSEQQQWIENNLCNHDVHVTLNDNTDKIVAYLNLINVKLILNGEHYEGFGIGNVCSLEEAQGFGGKLIKKNNQYIIEENKVGVLLCKKKLIPFYKKYGWILVSSDIVNLPTAPIGTFVMVFNYHEEVRSLQYSGKLF